MKQYKNPAVTVDIVVFMGGGIVLIKRKNDPFKDMFALPGGFIEYGKETLIQAAVRELKEETNLNVKYLLNPLGEYSHPRRDPRGHTITFAYYVELNDTYIKKLKAKDDAKEVKLFSLLEMPELAFDHAKIIRDAIDKVNEENYERD